MENLYDNLLEYYDEIFPVDQERIAFMEELARRIRPADADKNQRTKVLDVGCATGSFALALMKKGMDVTGIDLNPSMIQSACRRNPEPRTNARFFLMNMMEVGSAFSHGRFDIIVCLGNTLVHLDGPAQILSFLKQARDLLRPGGALVFQTVNYAKVLSENITRLPTIETTRSRFEREYRQRDDGRISFEATIFASNGQAVFRDRVALYPATPTELTDLVKEAGLKRLDLFEDFAGDTLKGNSLGLVGVSMR
ncbi:MAG: class I SAM-dependent methyltransferase [Treponemataceae bacterium]